MLILNKNNIFLIDKNIEKFESIQKKFEHNKNQLLVLDELKNNEVLFEKIREFLNK